MIVCPNCRRANDEDRQVCEVCGTSHTSGPTHLRPRLAVTERQPIEATPVWISGPRFVRTKDDDACLTPGPPRDTVVDGLGAKRWDVSVTSDSGTDYRMREVVVVRDGIGWRLALNDTAEGFDVSAATFTHMIDPWRFR
jgi:hypothetical protein